jgi:FkbM family methyltransferase
MARAGEVGTSLIEFRSTSHMSTHSPEGNAEELQRQWLQDALRSFPVDGKSVAILAPAPGFFEDLCSDHGGKPSTIVVGGPAPDHPPDEALELEAVLHSGARFDAAIAGRAVSQAGWGSGSRDEHRDRDLHLMGILTKIVAPDGVLFLALPVGEDDDGGAELRVYGQTRGPRLVRDWEVIGEHGYHKRQRRMLSPPDQIHEPLLVLRNTTESETLGLRAAGEDRVRRIGGGIHTQFIFDLAIRPEVDQRLPRGEVVSIEAPGLEHPLMARAGTSDLRCFNEILLAGDYDFQLPAMDPRLIIDGGANVGYSSALFASRYPNSRVIAVEAERSNFELLEANVAGFPNVEPVHGALWHRSAWLEIRNQESASWSFQVTESDDASPGSIEAITIHGLLLRSGRDQIDLLKLDVEGAEREIFSVGFEAWLPRVRVMFIELHDDIPGCKENFFAAIRDYDFEIEEIKGRYAKNLCLIRRDLLR